MELSQEQLNNLHQQWFERYQSVINLSEGNNELLGYADVPFNSTKDEVEAAGLEWEVQQALNSYHLDALDVYRTQVKIGNSKNNEPCYEFYSSSGTLLLNSDSIENIVNSFSFNHEVQKKVNPIEYTEQSDEEAKKQVSYLSTIVNKAMEEKNLEFSKNGTKKSIEEENALIIEVWTPEKGKQFLASLQTVFEARGEAFHLSSESLDGITKWNDDSESYYPLVDLKETGEPYLMPAAYQIKYPIDSKKFEKLFELEKHSFETQSVKSENKKLSEEVKRSKDEVWVYDPIGHKRDETNAFFIKESYKVGTVSSQISEIKELIQSDGYGSIDKAKILDEEVKAFENYVKTGKKDLLSKEVFINPTPDDFQKANVKVFGLKQKENLGVFIKEYHGKYSAPTHNNVYKPTQEIGR